MTNIFNVKVYQDKDRVYSPVPGRSGILRLYIWDAVKLRYEDPASGLKYDTRRVEIGENGKRRRVKKMFAVLDDAVLWQQGNDPNVVAIKSSVSLSEYVRSSGAVTPSGITYKQIIAKFRADRYPLLDTSTQTRYDRLLNQYFAILEPLVVKETKPQTVDLWLSEVKKICKDRNASQRKFYKHELDMFKTLVSYYKEYYDDENQFVLPFRKRHTETAHNRYEAEPVADLSEEDFLKFREALLYLKNGGLYAIMATLQFYQAWRISEAAGVNFEDFKLREGQAHASRVVVSRAVKWKRDTGVATVIGTLKNAEHIGGLKEQPVFPETFLMLRTMFPNLTRRKGPMFLTEEKKYFEYRQIQNAYDCAFEIARLDFAGTHIMRHGGCRLLLNETGDRYIAQQHLGNSTLASTDVYAIREVKALSEAVEKRWENFPDGRTWSQNEKVVAESDLDISK